MMSSVICHMPKVVNSPVLFNSPHSGRLYESRFLMQTQLNWPEIRLSEDCYVDKLLDGATDFGSILIEATFPRAFVDVNRSFQEMDPTIIKGLKKEPISPRIAAGLGVIPRVVGNGIEIYKKKITAVEANYRLKNYYFPYHDKLCALIEKTVQKFGFSILFDFHSMPRNSIQNGRKNTSSLPQIVLGDCFGASCHPSLVKKVHNLFVCAGLRVEMNSPFSGGYITKNYGSPRENVHVIQVEIDRSLYINEGTFKPHKGYKDLKERLAIVIESLCNLRNLQKLML